MIEPHAALVRRLHTTAHQLHGNVRALPLVHPQKWVEVQFDSQRAFDRKSLVQQVFHVLDVGLQRVGVIQLVQPIDTQAAGDRANTDFERRYAEWLADLLVGVAHLLDHLRVDAFHRKWREFHVGADDRHFSRLRAVELAVPVILHRFRVLLGHACRSRQQSTRLRVVRKKLGGGAHDLHVFQGRPVSGGQRRNADQRMVQRHAPVVDYLAGRDQ